jgi:hypothetical protein
MLLSAREPRSLDKPTVIFYHANAVHRDRDFISPNVTDMLEKGYNVLLASYAGDFAVQGDGITYKEVATQCTEKAMQDDAKADLEFLSSLGVKSIGLYGFSLGGAQAMNCAQAVKEGMNVDFIALDKTFSDAISVVYRTVKNATGLPFLARVASNYATRFFREEPDRAQCDCLDNVKKLEQVVRAPSFKSTQYYFFSGGQDDPMMTESGKSDNNFSLEMFKTVTPYAPDRVHLKLESKGHCPTTDCFLVT